MFRHQCRVGGTEHRTQVAESTVAEERGALRSRRKAVGDVCRRIDELIRAAGELRRGHRTLVIAVREGGGAPLAAQIRLGRTRSGTFSVQSEDRSVEVSRGRLADVFPGYAARVYVQEHGPRVARAAEPAPW